MLACLQFSYFSFLVLIESISSLCRLWRVRSTYFRCLSISQMIEFECSHSYFFFKHFSSYYWCSSPVLVSFRVFWESWSLRSMSCIILLVPFWVCVASLRFRPWVCRIAIFLWWLIVAWFSWHSRLKCCLRQFVFASQSYLYSMDSSCIDGRNSF